MSTRTSSRRSVLPPQSIINNNNLTPITRRRSVAQSAVSNAKSVKLLIPACNTPLILSQEPKTPVTSFGNETPKSRFVDPVFAKIQRDLNSPSAGARIRANKALKSPSFRKANYGIFDVPHERQDIITEEERRSIKPKSIQDIFSNCKIYVEVRTGDDNRSAGIKNRLLRDGITVNEKLYKDTTHVIFKDGLLSTYKNAQKLGIPITTILWIDACTAQRRLVDPERFKISNLDRYEHPELYKRLRRQKSMQPEVSKLTPKHFHGTLEKSFSQDDTRDSTKHFDNEIIMEGTEQGVFDYSGMELTLQNDNASQRTPCLVQVDPIDDNLDKWKQNIRRFTTFTPNPMEQTGIHAESDRRRTLFTPQLLQNTDEDKLHTPEGFSANSSKTVKFNSMNRISMASRRSVFDISMNLLELNCKALSQKTVNPMQLSEKKIQPASAQLTYQHTQTVTTTTVRKRKLFNTDNEEYEQECKENVNKSLKEPEKKRKLESAGWKTPTVIEKPKAMQPIDRRRTLSYFKTEKPKEVSTAKIKSPAKPAAATKYIVCTNMSSTDKKILQAAIVNLGGKVESEVTTKTTHVVSPNDERTMNILRGVIRACTIVNVDWIHASIAHGKWVDMMIYKHDICDANKVYERSILGKNYKNLTFADRGLFFLNKNGIDNIKKIDYLTEIITLCGGATTENQSEAKLVISDHPIQRGSQKQVVVVSTYIFDSAMKGTWLEATRYVPKTKTV